MKLLKYFFPIAVLLLLSSCEKEPGTSGGDGGTTTPKDWVISGTVKGNDGALLEGVVVSDGQYCVKTDKQGRYYLPSNLSRGDHEYVMVSTPSAYSAPVQDGHATFWKWLKECDKDTNGKYVADFTLEKIANPNRYSLFIFADPQPRGSNANYDKIAYHSLDCCNDMYLDMKEYAADRNYPVYGIGLGDIVHRDLKLLQQYRNGMATTGITTYNVIGNHDQGGEMNLSDPEASRPYEAIMGPTNYSFNLGNMHYLMLDNMMAQEGKPADECATGLTDDIWEWVKNDLSHVSLYTPIMVCAHSPMMRMENGTNRSGSHLDDLRYLLSKYKKAYVWAGHTHTSFNYVPTDEKIETHTVSRVTGALWTNEYLGSNGTPRGYVVFDYDDGEVSWKFKPIYYQKGKYVGQYTKGDKFDYKWRDWDYDEGTGRARLKSTGEFLDDHYQMQVFPPKIYGDNYLYVNIFLWDELWKSPYFRQDGEYDQKMKRVTEKNYCYSYSDWAITDFYSTRSASTGDFVTDKNNNSSMFRVLVESEHGSGKVSVVDRFGNEHTATITW